MVEVLHQKDNRQSFMQYSIILFSILKAVSPSEVLLPSSHSPYNTHTLAGTFRDHLVHEEWWYLVWFTKSSGSSILSQEIHEFSQSFLVRFGKVDGRWFAESLKLKALRQCCLLRCETFSLLLLIHNPGRNVRVLGGYSNQGLGLIQVFQKPAIAGVLFPRIVLLQSHHKITARFQFLSSVLRQIRGLVHRNSSRHLPFS